MHPTSCCSFFFGVVGTILLLTPSPDWCCARRCRMHRMLSGMPDERKSQKTPGWWTTWAMKKLWLFRVYRGPTQLHGDYFITHEIRIPIKQPGFNGKYPDCFFSLLNWYQIKLYIWLKGDAALQQCNIAKRKFTMVEHFFGRSDCKGISLLHEKLEFVATCSANFRDWNRLWTMGNLCQKVADLMGFSGSFALFWGKMDLKRTP